MADGNLRGPSMADYGRLLWRQRWLIIATVTVAVAVAVALSARQQRVYQATTDVIIQASAVQQLLDSTAQNPLNIARNIATEAAVLQSRVVQDAATAKLGHAPDVSVSSSDTSDVVSVVAQSRSARRAAADADGYADAYVSFRHKQTDSQLVQAGAQIELKIAAIDARLPTLRAGSPELSTTEQQRSFLQQQLDQLQLTASLNQVGGARVLARADVPTTPVEPQPVRNVAIALVFGLLLGIGLAFLRDYFDDSVKTRQDLELVGLNLPVLAEIPSASGWRDRAVATLVSRESPNSPGAEAYRTLRTAILFLEIDQKLRTIQITSANSAEGKTTTIANLAVAFARAGRRVAIIDCDLRHPRVHKFFGLSNELGFTSLLLGEASLDDTVQRVRDEPNITVLSAGPPLPNPSEALSTLRARDLIASVEKSCELVLVDSPPILPLSDALIVSGMVDATLVVASAKSSSRRALHRAVEVLRQVDAHLVGMVLNNSESIETYGSNTQGYVDR